MRSYSKNTSMQNAELLKAAVEAVSIKKDMMLRFEKGENARKIAKEKAFKIVFPL